MYEFNVNGMNCGGCASGVTRAVKSVDADAAVRVDLAAKTVNVQSTADQTLIRQAIEAAGYPVQATSKR